jgi:hypothetical protein
LRERRLTLLAMLAGSALGIGVTLWLAVGWAADQPRTIAFAIAREPFGSRSLLEDGNARAALDRILARLDRDDRVTDLHFTAESVSAMVRVPDGRRRSLRTEIDGAVDAYFTQGPPEGRGVPVAQIAALDLDAALRAAQRRWNALGTRPDAPLLSLGVRAGRPRGWHVIFSSAVPEAKRTTEIDLAGRAIG